MPDTPLHTVRRRHDLHQPPFRDVKNNCAEQLTIASVKVNLRPPEVRRLGFYLDSERIRPTAPCPPFSGDAGRPAGVPPGPGPDRAPGYRGDSTRALVHTGRLILLVSEVWFESADGKTRLISV